VTPGPAAQPWTVLLLCFIVNAGLAFLAVRALDKNGDPRLVGILSSLTGLVGVVNFENGVTLLPGLIIVWVICSVFVVSVCYDVRTRHVPLLYVVPVVALISVLDLYHADWASLATGYAIGLAFLGLSSMRSKGAAPGYGDAGLIALAGLTFGLELGLIVIAIACFASAAFAFPKRREGAVAVFAPYLAATVGMALLIPGR
jgi:prepilin signal peptidase PulO-like enzyme (type II secretory pathway)